MKIEALGALVALFVNDCFEYKRGLCVQTTFILEAVVTKTRKIEALGALAHGLHVY